MHFDRREFIKAAGLTSLLPLMQSAKTMPGLNPSIQQPDARPTAQQLKWMSLKFGMFVHLSINTYYDVEWSDGTLDISKFNPSEIDTDEWCRVAREAGMKYIVVVTKHHDGFCIWHTCFTNYSVKYTPFKEDLLKKITTSAQKYGLAVGIYYSLWDRHERSHDENDFKYVSFVKGQLGELLQNYGPVTELWFDGFWKKQKSGWETRQEINGEIIDRDSRSRDEDFITAWRMEGAYRWQIDSLYQYVKTIQPDCLVMNNSTTAYPGVPLHPVDIRSGEKYLKPKKDRKVWNWLGKPVYLPLQIETTMSVKGDKQFPSGNWFWHAKDHSVATKDDIRRWLDVAGQMEANLLLNVAPMPNGRLRPEDIEVLRSLNT